MDPREVHVISDSDGASDDEIDELDSIQKSTTITHRVRSDYPKAWGPREAFRELVQNWRDGIISSFRLHEAEFNVIREERRRGKSVEIVYKVLQPNSEPKEWLGFIRFHGTGDNTSGTVEIVNRKATLQPRHFDFGGSTKANDAQQAGAHGEGFKIALLVLQRQPQNHNIRCISGSFTWNFNFTTKCRLVARLTRMKPEQVANSIRLAEKNVSTGITPFPPSPDLDVHFLIGREVMGRDQYGRKIKRQAVSLDQFKSWCETALFLQEVEDLGIVGAGRSGGDLILDPKLRGNLYLKGLLLSVSGPFQSASRTGKPLKYGYNFRSGNVDRDRRSMSSNRSEGISILAIWNKILTTRRPHLVKELSEMLNSSEPEYADVLMAKEFIDGSTVIRLKEHLFEDKTKWYFSASEREKNPQLEKTIENLERTGVQLRDYYWELLSKHVPTLRTAEQEQKERFLAAERVLLPRTAFAESVDRLIRASLRACKYTDKLSIEFVKAGPLLIDIFFSSEGQSLRIHERWLDPLQALREFGLPLKLKESDAVFHTVKFLFEELLGQMPTGIFIDANRHTSLRRKRKEVSLAEQRIIDYYRVKKLAKKHEDIGQTYDRISKAWGEGGKVEIQFHHAFTCRDLRDCLIAADISGEQVSCIAKDSEIQDHARCFSSVNRDDGSTNGFVGEKYFLMVYDPSEPKSVVLFSENFRLTEGEESSEAHSTETLTDDDDSDVEITRERFLGPDTCKASVVDLTPSSLSSRAASPKAASPQPSSNADSDEVMADDKADSESGPDADVYVLGDKLESLDILTPRDWYETSNRVNGAVIGIPQSQETSGSPRKRRQRRE